VTCIDAEEFLEHGDNAALAGNAAGLREVALLLSARIGDPWQRRCSNLRTTAMRV
jgi:hypothetical protein